VISIKSIHYKSANQTVSVHQLTAIAMTHFVCFVGLYLNKSHLFTYFHYWGLQKERWSSFVNDNYIQIRWRVAHFIMSSQTLSYVNVTIRKFDN